MSQNLSSAAVVIGALRVNILLKRSNKSILAISMEKENIYTVAIKWRNLSSGFENRLRPNQSLSYSDSWIKC